MGQLSQTIIFITPTSLLGLGWIAENLT